MAFERSARPAAQIHCYINPLKLKIKKCARTGNIYKFIDYFYILYNGIHSSISTESGSSSAGIRVISASDIGQAANTGEIPLLFRSGVG